MGDEDSKQGAGFQIALLALGGLSTLLLGVLTVIASMALNDIGTTKDDVAGMKTQFALMQQTVDNLDANGAYQRQLSGQWIWLRKLHDEVNRQRFKDGLEALEVPQPDKDWSTN